MSSSQSLEFSSGMRDMTRPYKKSPEKFPKHTVPSAIIDGHGITFSHEENNKEQQAEFEVLKAILNRENYLNRLHQVVRTVGRKFKPEVADVLDLVRATTLDVIEMILRWRQVKTDHDSAFMWNGVNYILKMPSDLDYLMDYLAIKRWMGFSITRNPFCVPFPMEEGAGQYTENLMNPKHVEKGRKADGYVIGGMTQSNLKKKYLSQSFDMAKLHNNEVHPGLASFVQNSDMVKIRQAELVILREEEKFGILAKDPDGRIMPRLQALTATARHELKKDDKRPMIDPSQTMSYAPHAARSDVGVAEPSWTPDVDVNKDKSTSQVAEVAASHFVEETDDSVQPLTRGKAKLGGVLAPVTTRGVETRGRKPLKVTLASDVEFKRTRQIRTLGDKLNEINKLKEAILREKAKLEGSLYEEEEQQWEQQDDSDSVNGNKVLLRPISRSSAVSNASGGAGNSAARRQDLQRSVASSHTYNPATAVGKMRKEVSLMRSSSAGPQQPQLQLSQTGPQPSGGLGAEDMRETPSHSAAAITALSPLKGIRKRFNSTDSDRKSPTNATAGSATSTAVVSAEGSAKTSPRSGAGSPVQRITKQISFGRIPLGRSSSNLDKVAEVTEATEKLNKDTKGLDTQVIQINQKLNHYVRDEEKITQLKDLEKESINRERSRDIERKRRLLTEQEGRRVGPPPEDHRNVYDYYAIRVQSVIRGFVARSWIRWYRRVSLRACILLQAALRGWFGRMRVRRIRGHAHAATTIQRNFRGWRTRGTSSAMAKSQNLGKKATIIQRIWRGVLGVRRCISKRMLDDAAKAAFQCVDAKSITVGDVKELARRILYAIEEPHATTFPPDEVLYLIRLTVMVIQSARGNLGLAEYDFFNGRTYDEMGGEELNWHQAGKMVNRSERFLRLVRVMAFGPGAKPPRLVTLPNNANLLYAAQNQNPRWKLETFENMGAGWRICCQLFKWLTSVIEVAGRQQEFLSLIATSFPDWLPKLYDLQKSARINEFEIELNKKAYGILEQLKARSMDDDILLGILDKEMQLLKRGSNDARTRMKDLLTEIDKLKNDQSSREVYALMATEQKVLDANVDLDEMAKQFQNAFRLAGQGDRASIEALPELKVQLTNQRLKVTELDGQRKLLEMQVELNRNKRKNPAKLTPEIMFKVLVAGEARAAHTIAFVKAKTMLRSSGVKHGEDLPLHLMDIYEELHKEEERCRAEARKLFVDAENERKAYDELMSRSLSENEAKEQKNKDKLSPSVQELQEERFEDDQEAKAERKKHKQYLSDAVLLVSHPRPRPVIVALSRDLPLYAKTKLHEEVTRMMPGMFITIDCKENMGIDFHAMQSILDSNRCIIMYVDHGLTRMTRHSFLENLDINVKALVPSPVVALAIGDESNRRGGVGPMGAYHGVDKADLHIMRDGALKVSLEGMAWVLDEIVKTEVRVAFQKRAGELVASSKSFALVVEAFFIVLSGEDVYKSPDDGFAAATWRTTRKVLVEPRDIAAKLKKYRRGAATLHMVEVIRKYTQHSLWPEPYGPLRNEDTVCGLMAYYVEQWLIAETQSILGDGVPLQAITKSSMKGFQSVVVVMDALDPQDGLENNHGGGWKMASSKLVRASLQDMRVVKNVTKIDGQLYNLSVYRDGCNVYLEAYESATSYCYLTHVHIDNIPALLVPNGFGLSTGLIKPPQTPHEMYLAMIKLLRFDKVSKRKNAAKTLLCKRDYTFLCNSTRKINGHIALLKCYEAALGEMYFSAYLPEYSAHVKLLVGDDVRLGLLRNADTGETEEHKFVDGEDARPLLTFMMDRLRMSPSKAMTAAKGIDLNDGHRPKQGLPSMVDRMGFTLKVRTHGGAGRILVRRVKSFNGVPHVVEVRTSAHTKLLQVSLYEPRKRHTMTLRMSSRMRTLLLPEVSDDPHSWYSALMTRLHINWRGAHHLYLDTSLFKVVKRISSYHIVMRLHAVDDDDLVQLTLFYPQVCEYFSCMLTKEQLILLLIYIPPLEMIERSMNTNVKQAALRSILQSMKYEFNATLDKVISKETEPELFNRPMADILLNKEALQLLCKHLVLLLEVANPAQVLFGFVIRGPVKVDVLPDPNGSVKGNDRTVKLDTELKYTDRLKHGDREGSTEGVLRARRQAPVIDMEYELNELALRKAREADAKVLSDAIAARALADKMLELEGLDEEDVIINNASSTTATALLDTIQQQIVERIVERETPGTQQAAFESELEAEALIPKPVPVEVELNPILGKEWSVIFEAGVKSNFREGKVRWQGHVSVKISETQCWVGEDGIGKRYQFQVYEPKCAQTFEGMIRSKKHLIEILGLHGQDLIDPRRAREMLMYVCKYRLDVVVNKKTWDGEDVPEGSPAYRIEFQSDRLFTNDKITPVNVGTEDDEEANRAKLINMENARGKKIIRLVRRVSGLLMQLTVFDIPEQIVAAAEQQRKLNEASLPKKPIPAVPTAEDIVLASRDTVQLSADTVEAAGAVVVPEAVASRRNSLVVPPGVNLEVGFAELRQEVEILERYPPPAFRIVGYDPRSKRKVLLTVEPQCIVEVAGGVFSPFLNPERKKDLGKLICDALVLVFPSGRPFEMIVPWSGASKDLSTAEINKDDTKVSMRSSAERVIKRSGRLFRAAMRISKYDLLVSLYSHTISNVAGMEEVLNNRQLIFNFYSPAVSEASEFIVNETEQIARVQRPILSYPEGAMRAAAIRRFCKFFRCEIIEDILNPKLRTMHIVLLPPDKGFVNDYQEVAVPPPGESIRPVGIPAVFFPLDTCGTVIHRRGMPLVCRDKQQPDRDFLVTVYTKSPAENAERGMVIKLYDRGISTTSILHLGASELIRQCERVDEPDLLRDIVTAKTMEDAHQVDEIETGFLAITTKGELQAHTKKLVDYLVDIILNDLGYLLDSQQNVVPYMRSAPRGVPPT